MCAVPQPAMATATTTMTIWIIFFILREKRTTTVLPIMIFIFSPAELFIGQLAAVGPTLFGADPHAGVAWRR
jgi:hypothetical protein